MRRRTAEDVTDPDPRATGCDHAVDGRKLVSENGGEPTRIKVTKRGRPISKKRSLVVSYYHTAVRIIVVS